MTLQSAPLILWAFEKTFGTLTVRSLQNNKSVTVMLLGTCIICILFPSVIGLINKLEMSLWITVQNKQNSTFSNFDLASTNILVWLSHLKSFQSFLKVCCRDPLCIRKHSYHGVAVAVPTLSSHLYIYVHFAYADEPFGKKLSWRAYSRLLYLAMCFQSMWRKLRAEQWRNYWSSAIFKGPYYTAKVFFKYVILT